MLTLPLKKLPDLGFAALPGIRTTRWAFGSSKGWGSERDTGDQDLFLSFFRCFQKARDEEMARRRVERCEKGDLGGDLGGPLPGHSQFREPLDLGRCAMWPGDMAKRAPGCLPAEFWDFLVLPSFFSCQRNMSSPFWLIRDLWSETEKGRSFMLASRHLKSPSSSRRKSGQGARGNRFHATGFRVFVL